MPIKTAIRYHLTPPRMAIMKKILQEINAREDVEKREPSCNADGNINWYNLYGEQYGSSKYHGIQVSLF